jgi:hypothetical protein
MKLSAQDKADLAAHVLWREWGARFGWKLHGSDGENAAAFYRPGERSFEITKLTRENIDAAIAAERERCAKIVEAALGGGDDECDPTLRRIADAIRFPHSRHLR